MFSLLSLHLFLHVKKFRIIFSKSVSARAVLEIIKSIAMLCNTHLSTKFASSLVDLTNNSISHLVSTISSTILARVDKNRQ